MTTQYKWQILVFTSKLAALFLAVFMFFGLGQLNADTVPITSVVVNSPAFDLISFVADGNSYTQADLIQPTLTAFAGASPRTIVAKDSDGVPVSGSRSLLLTHDYDIQTGLANVAIGSTSATLAFTPALVNGSGPDLVIFDLQEIGVEVQVNGSTVIYDAASYYTTDLLSVPFSAYSREIGTPTTLSQLENDTYFLDRSGRTSMFGIAIDLDDFNVDPLTSVSDVHFGSISPGGNFTFADPMLFMGINSAPERTADFNNDRNVDSDDLSIWKANFGLADPWARPAHEYGDADEDGDVDGRDFLAWQREVDDGLAASGTSVNIPEPGTWLLGTVALTLCLAMRNQQLTRSQVFSTPRN